MRVGAAEADTLFVCRSRSGTPGGSREPERSGGDSLLLDPVGTFCVPKGLFRLVGEHKLKLAPCSSWPKFKRLAALVTYFCPELHKMLALPMTRFKHTTDV